MKKLIAYYSYSGNSRKIATELAKIEATDILEILDAKKISKFGAYVKGCFASLRMKPSKIQAVNTDLSAYDIITIVSPVWAGHPTPPIIALIELLPVDKKIEMIMVSGSGKCDARNKIESLLQAKGCVLVNFKNIKK